MKNKNWLHDNIVPTIALTYIGFSFIIKIMILLGLTTASETLVSTIESNDNNLLIFVFGFYFGSSVTANKKGLSGTIENANEVNILQETKPAGNE